MSVRHSIGAVFLVLAILSFAWRLTLATETWESRIGERKARIRSVVVAIVAGPVFAFLAYLVGGP
jgi:hypothetical protein